MLEGTQHEKPQYQNSLRVIGRHLDAEPAHTIAIVEGTDGFEVTSHSSDVHSDLHKTHFSWDRLRDLAIVQTAGRGLNRKHHRHLGLWTNLPNGHEDFFRALGFRLDREEASGLIIDEMPDRLTVSYTIPDAKRGERRVETSFREEDVRSSVTAAQSRRGDQASNELRAASF